MNRSESINLRLMSALSAPFDFEIPLDQLPLVIGRASGAGFRLKDQSTSRRHCELQHLNDALWVFDLNSKNGTLVNGKRVLESPLVAGDTLQIGCWLFVVADDSAPLQSSQETVEDFGTLNQPANRAESRSEASCSAAG
jgi:pSer/pThr/pTyr-binding forkhead associated (FHA) protein